jgi:hypothetical protein
MDKDHVPCCAADALWRIRKVTINGIATGISRLDESIAAVLEEDLKSGSAIRTSLMTRIRASNYIPPGAEEAYATALVEEYRRAQRCRETRMEDREG